MAQTEEFQNIQLYLDSLRSSPTVPSAGSVDVTNRAARQLGQVSITSMPAISGSVLVAGTVAISAASLPLPTGAATAALQSAVIVQAGASVLDGSTIVVQGNAGGWPVPISALSLPLPTGAATAALQANSYDASNNVLQVVQKKIAASTYAPTLYKNLGAAHSAVVKASPGNVCSVSCYNKTTSGRHFQLHNASTPLTLSIPIFQFIVPSKSQIIIGEDFFSQVGCHFDTVISFGLSTVPDTFTAAGAADHSTWIQYK